MDRRVCGGAERYGRGWVCGYIGEGVSPQCDRVTLWTFGGTEITFWGGARLGLVWEGGTEADGEIWVPSGNG